jgi:hypothetical protein
MIDLSRELESLRPLLGDARTDTLLRRERREVFSLYPELRICAWAGAMLLATAAGLVLKNNLDRIGPIALAMLIGVAAIACYAFVWFRRARASLGDEFVLLLGALLVSGDVAFIESRFHLFGEAWYRHFLILAVVHGLGAYVFHSRTLLSLAITALAGWLGLRGILYTGEPTDYALRAFACAAFVLIARFANRREEFHGTYEHFVAMLLLLGGLTLSLDARWYVLGTLLTMAFAAAIVWWGFRTRREPFVLYAFVCGVIAFDILIGHLFAELGVVFFFMLVSAIGGIATLFVLHAKFKESA